MRVWKRPVEVEGVQFDGSNWGEIQLFVGTRKTEDDHDIVCFNPVGTYLPEYLGPFGSVAELWVHANSQWVYIEAGEWILKDRLGFYPCKSDIFNETYTTEHPDAYKIY